LQQPRGLALPEEAGQAQREEAVRRPGVRRRGVRRQQLAEAVRPAQPGRVEHVERRVRGQEGVHHVTPLVVQREQHHGHAVRVARRGQPRLRREEPADADHIPGLDRPHQLVVHRHVSS
jgi:hypothetical protein